MLWSMEISAKVQFSYNVLLSWIRRPEDSLWILAFLLPCESQGWAQVIRLGSKHHQCARLIESVTEEETSTVSHYSHLPLSLVSGKIICQIMGLKWTPPWFTVGKCWHCWMYQEAWGYVKVSRWTRVLSGKCQPCISWPLPTLSTPPVWVWAALQQFQNLNLNSYITKTIMGKVVSSMWDACKSQKWISHISRFSLFFPQL